MAVTLTAPTNRVVPRGTTRFTWQTTYPQSAYEIQYRRVGETAWGTFGRETSTSKTVDLDVSRLTDFTEYHFRIAVYAVSSTSGTTIYNGSETSAVYSIIVTPEDQLAVMRVKYGTGMVEVPIYSDTNSSEFVKVRLSSVQNGHMPMVTPDETSATELRVRHPSGTRALANASNPKFSYSNEPATTYMQVKSRNTHYNSHVNYGYSTYYRGYYLSSTTYGYSSYRVGYYLVNTTYGYQNYQKGYYLSSQYYGYQNYRVGYYLSSQYYGYYKYSTGTSITSYSVQYGVLSTAYYRYSYSYSSGSKTYYYTSSRTYYYKTSGGTAKYSCSNYTYVSTRYQIYRWYSYACGTGSSPVSYKCGYYKDFLNNSYPTYCFYYVGGATKYCYASYASGNYSTEYRTSYYCYVTGYTSNYSSGTYYYRDSSSYTDWDYAYRYGTYSTYYRYYAPVYSATYAYKKYYVINYSAYYAYYKYYHSTYSAYYAYYRYSNSTYSAYYGYYNYATPHYNPYYGYYRYSYGQYYTIYYSYTTTYRYA